MALADWIVVGVIILILTAVITYIVKEKKNGAKCIGCPSSKTCSAKQCGANTACGCSKNNHK